MVCSVSAQISHPLLVLIMPEKCVVCQKIGGHRIPTDPEMQNKWREALGLVDRRTGQLWQPTRKAQVVCKDHFKASDYMPIGKKGTGKHRRLHSWAVPSVFSVSNTTPRSRRRNAMRISSLSETLSSPPKKSSNEKSIEVVPCSESLTTDFPSCNQGTNESLSESEHSPHKSSFENSHASTSSLDNETHKTEEYDASTSSKLKSLKVGFDKDSSVKAKEENSPIGDCLVDINKKLFTCKHCDSHFTSDSDLDFHRSYCQSSPAEMTSFDPNNNISSVNTSNNEIAIDNSQMRSKHSENGGLDYETECYVKSIMNRYASSDSEAVGILSKMLDKSINLESEVYFVENGVIQFKSSQQCDINGERSCISSKAQETRFDKEKFSVSEEKKSLKQVQRKSKRKSSTPMKILLSETRCDYEENVDEELTSDETLSETNAASNDQSSSSSSSSVNICSENKINCCLQNENAASVNEKNITKHLQDHNYITGDDLVVSKKAPTITDIKKGGCNKNVHNLMIVGNTVVLASKSENQEDHDVTMVNLADNELIDEDEEFRDLKQTLKDILKQKGKMVKQSHNDNGKESELKDKLTSDMLEKLSAAKDAFVYYPPKLEELKENTNNNEITEIRSQLDREHPHEPSNNFQSTTGLSQCFQIKEGKIKKILKPAISENHQEGKSVLKDSTTFMFCCGLCQERFANVDMCMKHLNEKHISKGNFSN